MKKNRKYVHLAVQDNIASVLGSAFYLVFGFLLTLGCNFCKMNSYKMKKLFSNLLKCISLYLSVVC